MKINKMTTIDQVQAWAVTKWAESQMMFLTASDDVFRATQAPVTNRLAELLDEMGVSFNSRWGFFHREYPHMSEYMREQSEKEGR